MKNEKEIEDLINELNEEWTKNGIDWSYTARRIINAKIKILEWVLDRENVCLS
jgi:hypothetical protein